MYVNKISHRMAVVLSGKPRSPSLDCQKYYIGQTRQHEYDCDDRFEGKTGLTVLSLTGLRKAIVSIVHLLRFSIKS